MKKFIALLVVFALIFSLASVANAEESGVLRLYGPGLFASVGPDGTTDVVTGVTKPGYNEVIARWNELYPNVTLQIETIPWDNWKAALQTAALSGEVDIVLHGASITAICEPLNEYLAAEPEVADAVGMMAMRKSVDIAPLDTYVPFGLTVTCDPIVVCLDKEIFEHYGVELPDFTTWTLADLASLAEKLTGTDPVTGEQTYGISLIEAASINKNYIWASRAFNNVIYEWGDSIATTKVHFKTEKTAEVLNYIANFSKYSNPDYIEGLDRAVTFSSDNNVAICIVEGAYGCYSKIKANGVEDKFCFVSLPLIQEGEFAGITSSHMGDWNMAICKTSEQKDLAWKFMKFMVTDPVVQEWLLATASVPSNKEASGRLNQYMSADFADAISFIVRTAPLQFSASANNCYDSSNFGTFLNDVTTVLNEMFQGNMDADAAMDYVQNNLDQYLATLQK